MTEVQYVLSEWFLVYVCEARKTIFLQIPTMSSAIAVRNSSFPWSLFNFPCGGIVFAWAIIKSHFMMNGCLHTRLHKLLALGASVAWLSQTMLVQVHYNHVDCVCSALICHATDWPSSIQPGCSGSVVDLCVFHSALHSPSLSLSLCVDSTVSWSNYKRSTKWEDKETKVCVIMCFDHVGCKHSISSFTFLHISWCWFPNILHTLRECVKDFLVLLDSTFRAASGEAETSKPLTVVCMISTDSSSNFR